MERRIIHLNIADFGVAVERQIDRSLCGRAVILAVPAARSFVYDMSDEAYHDGVRKGMPLRVARQCCRATVLAPRPEQYGRALDRCLRHALHYTPLVERSTGSGHLYLDVTGTHRLFGPAPDIGWRLRNTLRQDLGLDPIWAVAPNKLVAKVASRLVKPVGEYIVGEGEEAAFLAPLPLPLLPGLGTGELDALRQVNIRTVRQATALSLTDLQVLCRKRAENVYQAVRGIDSSPVQTAPPNRERSYQHLFVPDSNDQQQVRAALAGLVQQAGGALREQRLVCRQLSVQLRYSDGSTVSRQKTIPQGLSDDSTLYALAVDLLWRGWQRRVRLRQLHLCCSRLCRSVQQLSLLALLDAGAQKNRQVSAALDSIRHRCGREAIARGVQLLTVPS